MLKQVLASAMSYTKTGALNSSHLKKERKGASLKIYIRIFVEKAVFLINWKQQ